MGRNHRFANKPDRRASESTVHAHANGTRPKRVAFVVQRCGAEVNGGAEVHCLQVAQRMSKHFATEVLTTCAVDYVTWDNFYPPGEERSGGTVIRRFRVDRPRDQKAFEPLSASLAARQSRTSLEEQEEWMRAQGPISTELFDYIRREKDRYDAFVFFGYLYATTYFGLPLVEEKAFLAPLAHDEWPIYFTMFDTLFARPRSIIFNTAAERKFLQRRFPDLALNGSVVALGVERPQRVEPEEFRRRYGITGPFLLYVGRIDRAKGCDTLFDYFIRARESGTIEHQLVTIGREVLPVPFHQDVIHLGFVDDQEKWNALAACDWLVMPSPHESLSMVLLEAWSVGRPAQVNGQCDVLRSHCQQANAGVWYEDYEEWAASLHSIGAREKEMLGRQGASYVTTNYSWERVERDYLSLLS